MKKRLLLFFAIALLYAGPGLLPGWRLAPADIPRDYLAWKGDPTVRVRVSNSLLSDVPLQSIAWDVEARRLLANGEIPWMNRHSGTEEHLWANPLAGLFSPFTWPRLILGLRGWALTLLLKIVVAALAAFWLARSLGADEPAAIMSGIIYSISGFAITWAEWPHTNVVVLLPAIAASAIDVAERPSARRVLVAGLIACVTTLSGHPESLCLGVLATFAFLLLTRRRILPFAAAALAGFLLAGFHIVPFLQLLRQSHAVHTRSGQFDIRFRLAAAPSMILPGMLGSPLRGELDLTGLVPHGQNFNQRTGGFIGAIAFAALLLTLRNQSRDLKRALAIALASLALTLSVPGLTHLLKKIPLLQWIAFEYFQVPFLLFGCAAAGMALFTIARGAQRPRIGLAIIVLGATLFIGGAVPAVAPRLVQRVAETAVSSLQSRGYLRQSSDVYRQRLSYYVQSARLTAFRRVALPGLCWLLAGIALRMSASRRRELLLCSAAVAELVFFGVGYNPWVRVDDIAREPQMIAEVKRRDPRSEYLTGAGYDVFPANMGTIFGVRQSHAYDILTTVADTERLRPAGYNPDVWTLPLEPTPQQLQILGEQGVRFYLTPRGLIEIANARKAPPARNEPPRGLAAGAIVSLVGAVLLALTARHYSHSIVLGGLDETS